jgi:hypothetical protein
LTTLVRAGQFFKIYVLTSLGHYQAITQPYYLRTEDMSS